MLAQLVDVDAGLRLLQPEEGHVRLAQPLERLRGDANCAQPDESRGSTHVWC